MTGKKMDGGPAFPLTNRDYQEAYGGAPGVALRDYFATNINLVEEVTRPLAVTLNGSDMPSGEGEEAEFARFGWYAQAEARYRYMLADAMLKERAR